MSDTKHPLIDLLAFSKIDTFIDLDKFKVFEKIRAALVADDKSLFIESGDIRAGFEESISNTNDLYSEQNDVIAGLISVWCASTTLPMIEALNKHKHSTDIAHYYSGSVKHAQLFFEFIEEFTNDMPKSNAAAALAVLEDWSNTQALFVNADELKAALHSQAN